MTAWLTALCVPAIAAWAVIAGLRASRLSRPLADHPNERSLHATPTPRIGGLGLLAGALPIAFAVAPALLVPTLVAAGLLALLSLADDLRSLPVGVRLPAHLAGAAAACVSLLGVPTSASALLLGLLAVLCIAWMTNLYNFMDGADGLAGGMAVIGFGALAAGAALAGQAALALVCAAFASASAGFLVHNFPPARVFLGDAGAIPLGFLAAALGLAGVRSGAWGAEFPVLVFSPFIVDATVTLAGRVLRREPFWKAHRTHHYQRLVLSGWSRRRLALWAYVLMSAAASSALLAQQATPGNRSAIISVWAVAYALLLRAIQRSVRRKAPASAKTQ